MNAQTLALFEAYGVEIEYIIVSCDNLDVVPLADKLFYAESKNYENFTRDGIRWVHTLTGSDIRLTAKISASLEENMDALVAQITRINQLLEGMGARLMPTAMHPWMDPKHQTVFWKHPDAEFSQAIDKTFGCRDHGWSNVHGSVLYMPFADDKEFGILHAASRFLLPILPALSASSPLCEARPSGMACTRLHVLRNSFMQVPSVLGKYIPEPVYNRKDYEMNILARIYQDLSPYDPDNHLQHEWMNARGVVPRFPYGMLALQALDMQECPRADISVMMTIVGVLKSLVAQRWVGESELRNWPMPKLLDILSNCIIKGHEAVIDDEDYLRALNFNSASQATAQELWLHLLDSMSKSSTGTQSPQGWREPVELILQQGTLSRRIGRALGRDVSREHQKDVYADLCHCLAQNKLFRM